MLKYYKKSIYLNTYIWKGSIIMQKKIDWDEFLKNNKEFDIVIHKDLLPTILEDIKNETDKDGFIIDTGTGERIISKDEDDIKLSEFGVVATGSKVFIKNNIASFSEFLIEKNRER